MSNAELLIEPEEITQETEPHCQRSREIEINLRSQEMLLVLNEVFDSIVPSNKS